MFDYLADTNAPEGLLHNETISVDAPIIPTTPQDYVDVLQEFTTADRKFTAGFIIAPPVVGAIIGSLTRICPNEGVIIGTEVLLYLAAAGTSIGSMYCNNNITEISSSQHTTAVTVSLLTPIFLAHKASGKKLFSWLE